jgi:hypothetical protein
MSHYSEEELVGIFERAGLVCAETTIWENQRIFSFVSSRAASKQAAMGGLR